MTENEETEKQAQLLEKEEFEKALQERTRRKSSYRADINGSRKNS